MIYFISNWTETTVNLEEDCLLHVSKQFGENRQDYRILTVNYLPFLRYMMQSVSALSEKYISIFDFIQNIETSVGHPLTIEDIQFPEDIEQLFHPNGVTLLREGKEYGNVYFNEHGCLEKIIYENDNGSIVDYYDDRGFLSIKEIRNETNQIVKKKYFNEHGYHTLSECLDETPQIIIEKMGNSILRKQKFLKIEDVVRFTISLFLEEINSKEDQVIFEVSPFLIQLLNAPRLQKKKIIPIFFENSRFDRISNELQQFILKESTCIVTDTTNKKNDLEKSTKYFPELKEKKIVFIPIYTTEVRLGISNSIPQLIIYLKIDEINQHHQSLYQAIVKEMIQNPEYSLVIQVNNTKDQETLTEMHHLLVNKHFEVDHLSEDYQKVETFIKAKKATKLFEKDEKAVEGIRKTAKWPKLVEAVETVDRFEFLVSPSVTSIKVMLSRARIFIDLNKKNHLLLQSIAVSAGIPLVLKEETDYLINGKNGLIAETIPESIVAMNYFLTDLDHWNKSLVESIEVIKKNSIEQTMKKWRRVLNE
ncbi:accessory Sec system protein Asp1 [Enterococcus sp. LJL99]